MLDKTAGFDIKSEKSGNPYYRNHLRNLAAGHKVFLTNGRYYGE